jgi:hypothetical protein
MVNNEIKIGSERSFGIVFSILFFIIALFPLLSGNNIRLWSLFISLIFLILGFTNSFLLSPLNKIWFKFGILLGNIISPLVMGAIFFIVITPTSLILKLIKLDILKLKKNNNNSYWIEKSGRKSRMKDQF